jgi:hypothetical protein
MGAKWLHFAIGNRRNWTRQPVGEQYTISRHMMRMRGDILRRLADQHNKR